MKIITLGVSNLFDLENKLFSLNITMDDYSLIYNITPTTIKACEDLKIKLQKIDYIIINNVLDYNSYGLETLYFMHKLMNIEMPRVVSSTKQYEELSNKYAYLCSNKEYGSFADILPIELPHKCTVTKTNYITLGRCRIDILEHQYVGVTSYGLFFVTDNYHKVLITGDLISFKPFIDKMSLCDLIITKLSLGEDSSNYYPPYKEFMELPDNIKSKCYIVSAGKIRYPTPPGITLLKPYVEIEV